MKKRGFQSDPYFKNEFVAEFNSVTRIGQRTVPSTFWLQQILIWVENKNRWMEQTEKGIQRIQASPRAWDEGRYKPKAWDEGKYKPTAWDEGKYKPRLID